MKYKKKSGAEPKVSKPSASVVQESIRPKEPRIEPPQIAAGEWTHVLNNETGTYYLTLDYGALRWLWDLAENRAVYGNDHARRSGDSEFADAYLRATCRAVDAFRREAAQHPELQHIRAPKDSQPPVVREAKLTQADHDPAATVKRKAPAKKSAPKKGRPKFKVKR